jgi:dodecin
MPENVFKKIEIVGNSKKSVDEAIHNAIETAAKTVQNIAWFEVVETTGRVDDGKVDQIQVTLKIGFKIESD